MKRLVLFLFFTVILTVNAQSAVISAYYDDLRTSLYIFSAFADKTTLNEISLRDCRNEQTFSFDKNARNFTVSNYIPSFVIYSTGAQLKIFDVFSHKTQDLKTEFSKTIRIISQSSNGEFFAVSDSVSIQVFVFEKDKVKPLFYKEMIAPVIDILPDTENKLLYVAERNGGLSAWSFDGKLVNASNIKTVPSHLIFDEILGRILVVAKNGIFALNKSTFVLTKILDTSSINDVFLDNYARRLTVTVPSGSAVYDYPSMRLISMIPGNGGKIVKTGRVGFSAFASGISVDIFDMKLSQNIARISVNEKGISFVPPKNDKLTTPFGITTAFINDVVGNKNNIIKPNQSENVCAILAAVVSGVYYPSDGKSANISSPNMPKINETTAKSAKIPDTVANIKPPTVNFKYNATLPQIDELPPQPTVPTNPTNPTSIIITGEQTEPAPSNLAMAEGSVVPSWIIKRKTLPYYQSVGSGSTYELATANAEKNLKNNLVRALIDIFLKKPETATIKNADVKKRLMWQAASAAAVELAKNFTILNKQTSPVGVNYILAEINEKTITKISDEKFKQELNRLADVSNIDYLKIKPNKID